MAQMNERIEKTIVLNNRSLNLLMMMIMRVREKDRDENLFQRKTVDINCWRGCLNLLSQPIDVSSTY